MITSPSQITTPTTASSPSVEFPPAPSQIAVEALERRLAEYAMQMQQMQQQMIVENQRIMQKMLSQQQELQQQLLEQQRTQQLQQEMLLQQQQQLIEQQRAQEKKMLEEKKQREKQQREYEHEQLLQQQRIQEQHNLMKQQQQQQQQQQLQREQQQLLLKQRQVSAAISIQKVVRGFLSRRRTYRLAQQTYAAFVIQGAYTRYRARKKFLREYSMRNTDEHHKCFEGLNSNFTFKPQITKAARKLKRTDTIADRSQAQYVETMKKLEAAREFAAAQELAQLKSPEILPRSQKLKQPALYDRYLTKQKSSSQSMFL